MGLGRLGVGHRGLTQGTSAYEDSGVDWVLLDSNEVLQKVNERLPAINTWLVAKCETRELGWFGHI